MAPVIPRWWPSSRHPQSLGWWAGGGGSWRDQQEQDLSVANLLMKAQAGDTLEFRRRCFVSFAGPGVGVRGEGRVTGMGVGMVLG